MYVTISHADSKYTVGEVLDVLDSPMIIYMILGDKVYVRKLSFIELIIYKIGRR